MLEEFRQDIIHKDAYALTKLMLNPNILFHSIDNQKAVDSALKHNAQFDGIGPSVWMDLRDSLYVEGQTRERNFTTSRFARTVI